MQDAGDEFTRWINVERLGREPIKFDIIASEAERADIANRLDILGISCLEASGSVGRKDKSDLIELSMTVKADVAQSCVVSLESVMQKIEENATVCYTFDQKDTFVEDVDYVVELEEEDLPELIEDGQIDVVQAISEQIALALDPYPRAEGVEKTESADILQEPDEEEKVDEQDVYKPFANLKDLMNKK